MLAVVVKHAVGANFVLPQLGVSAVGAFNTDNLLQSKTFIFISLELWP